jgi:hypothetical protein
MHIQHENETTDQKIKAESHVFYWEYHVNYKKNRMQQLYEETP